MKCCKLKSKCCCRKGAGKGAAVSPVNSQCQRECSGTAGVQSIRTAYATGATAYVSVAFVPNESAHIDEQAVPASGSRLIPWQRPPPYSLA